MLFISYRSIASPGRIADLVVFERLGFSDYELFRDSTRESFLYVVHSWPGYTQRAVGVGFHLVRFRFSAPSQAPLADVRGFGMAKHPGPYPSGRPCVRSAHAMERIAITIRIIASHFNC